jgi:thioredoxin 1
MLQLTTKELKEKISNGENFVLDLYATWCGPCKVMLTNLEKVNEVLIKESNGSPSFGVYKFDVDTDREFAIELGIRSVPTIKIFKKGDEFYSKTGVMSPVEVLDLLK